MRNQAHEQQSVSTFTPVDSVARLIEDIRKAGYNAWEYGGGVQTDMPDEVYQEFMQQRGFIRDEE